MSRFIALFCLVFLAWTPLVGHSKTAEQKIQDIAWVVFCEDATTERASRLVMSTIYNRAKSHSVSALHKAVSAKRQYYCYQIRPTARQLKSAKFAKVKNMVRDFIQHQRRPITKAKYFYNHRLVKRSKLGKMRLTVAEVHGSHTYLF